MDPLPTIEILGVPVVKATPERALAEVESLADERAPAHVVYVNAHTLNLAHTDASYREVLRRAAIVLNDGSGVALAARMKGDRFPANLNGSDFNPEILRLSAERGWKVFFLGAADGVAVEAASKMAGRFPGLQIAGARGGYFGPGENEAVARDIAATGADVVMVAMGNPKQERWLDEHLATTGCRLGVGVGAFFDFAAQRVRRAPAWMNRLGIEWVWRLMLEPGRLWKRYVVGNPAFLWRVFRER